MYAFDFMKKVNRTKLNKNMSKNMYFTDHLLNFR